MENLEWILCLVLSALTLVVTAGVVLWQGFGKNLKIRSLNTFRLMFAGVAVSAVALFTPFYFHLYAKYDCNGFEAFMIVLYNVIRLFLVNGEYDLLAEALPSCPLWLNNGYTVLYSALLILAPIMTFSFVLSFFKNLSAYIRYVFCFGRETFVFSELSQRSVALATSLQKAHKDAVGIVFTDVSEQEENQDLIVAAKELGGICFAKDITAVKLSFHSRKKALRFFTTSEDENANVTQALKLIGSYRTRPNTYLYAFSSGTEGELLLSRAFDDGDSAAAMKVRRIHICRSLIYQNLCATGVENIFHKALEQDGVRHINALVVGMGQHGREMVKALSWYGQMIGYRLTIHVVDQQTGAEDRFRDECPELMSEKCNHRFDIQGEAGCSITFHEEMDCFSGSFRQLLKQLPPTTYAFVALGEDTRNVAAATHLRSIFAGMGQEPAIQAVVYSTDMNEALQGITNYRNQAYDVDFIGDLASSYSADVVLGLDVEKMALERHLLYGKESDFWKFDYNYDSSVASAIHLLAKKQLKVPGIELAPKDRTPEQRQALRILEHCRWNAYMRSIGYVYGGTIERSGRNDLAKRHNCLVAFADLPPHEQEKDDI